MLAAFLFCLPGIALQARSFMPHGKSKSMTHGTKSMDDKDGMQSMRHMHSMLVSEHVAVVSTLVATERSET